MQSLDFHFLAQSRALILDLKAKVINSLFIVLFQMCFPSQFALPIHPSQTDTENAKSLLRMKRPRTAAWRLHSQRIDDSPADDSPPPPRQPLQTQDVETSESEYCCEKVEMLLPNSRYFLLSRSFYFSTPTTMNYCSWTEMPGKRYSSVCSAAEVTPLRIRQKALLQACFEGL